MLQHQEADSQGELETKLIKVRYFQLLCVLIRQKKKISDNIASVNLHLNHSRIILYFFMKCVLFFFQGDVYKTTGGGRCVQFTDVETLKTNFDLARSPERYLVTVYSSVQGYIENELFLV